jgi:hypothetical protein
MGVPDGCPGWRRWPSVGRVDGMGCDLGCGRPHALTARVESPLEAGVATDVGLCVSCPGYVSVDGKG